MAFDILKGNRRKDLERRFITFSEQLAQAFAQIKTDMGEVNRKIDSNQQEVERIGQWIDYLNRSNQRLSEHSSRLSEKYEKITENHQKLHTSHHELRSGHSQVSEIAARTAEEVKNKHQELSEAISEHREGLKSEFHSRLKEHQEASEEDIRRLKTWIDYLSTHLERQKAKEEDLKQDITRIQKNWLEAYSKLRELVNGLQHENGELKSSLSSVQQELVSAKEELEKSHDFAESRILQAKSELSEQIKELRAIAERPRHASQEPEMTPLQSRPQPAQQSQVFQQPVVQQVSPSTPFQRHIMSRVMPNRKGYVLKFILDLVGESKYSTKEVEEIVVNEKQLCGRTSFYAYLKELKLKGRLAYAEIDERTILVSTDTQQKLTDGLSERLERS